MKEKNYSFCPVLSSCTMLPLHYCQLPLWLWTRKLSFYTTCVASICIFHVHFDEYACRSMHGSPHLCAGAINQPSGVKIAFAMRKRPKPAFYPLPILTIGQFARLVSKQSWDSMRYIPDPKDHNHYIAQDPQFSWNKKCTSFDFLWFEVNIGGLVSIFSISQFKAAVIHDWKYDAMDDEKVMY